MATMKLLLRSAVLSVLCLVMHVQSAAVKQDVCIGKADVVFAVDASSSAGNLGLVKQLISDVIGKLDVSPQDIRIGALHYDSNAFVDFDLGTHGSSTAAQKGISSIPYTSGASDTAEAIRKISYMMAVKGRAGVPQVGVVLTDNASDLDDTLGAAAAARNAGIGMVAVGVGNDIDLIQVEGVASSPQYRNVFLSDFTSLHTIVNKLANVICLEAGGYSTIADADRVLTNQCLSDCHSMGNGYFQSCRGCGYYITCANHVTYDGRQCPAGLVWDDLNKGCRYNSQTCY